MSKFMKQLDDDLAAVVAKTQESLVQISNGPRGQGAGVIWSSEGLILTNAHVLRRRSLQVTLADGRKLPLEILAIDRKNDLAFLHVSAESLHAIERRDSRNLQPGEWVFAMGHPWGVAGAASGGVVIGMGSQLPENPRPNQEWIAVNLPLRPGHSGGPLVDIRGRLVGINAIMAGYSVGLAIPVHVAETFLDQVQADF
jgi:serine protease Do